MKLNNRHIIKLIFLGIFVLSIASCSSSRPRSSTMKKKKAKKCNCPTFSQNININNTYFLSKV